MKKRVFITGCAGFIGFHLACRLKQRGLEVLGYDNFNDYYSPLLKRARAKELAKLGIDVIEADINQSDFLKKSIEEHKTTHLVHLAAQAGVRYSLENPHAYIKTNIEGFLNILETCKKHPEMKLVYASSSSVYGLNKKSPFSTGDRTDEQASLYGVTKKTNELMAQTYHHLFGITSIGLRFFTVYGPWGRPDMAYFLFTEAILKGDAISVFNDGNMERDFTYIDDIIDGIESALDKGKGCEIFNLGNHRPEKLIALINCIEKKLNMQAIKKLLPMQPGDVLSTYADIRESTERLGFAPKISLEEGVSRFVDWYRDYLKSFK